MEQTRILEYDHQDHALDVFACLRRARMEGKKRLSEQILEIIKLSTGNNKLTPEEYYYYRLYNDEEYSIENKMEFLGKNAQTEIYLRCNTPTWWFVAHDKLAFYGLMRGLDLPIPEIRALCHPYRTFGRVPALRDAASVERFLVEPGTYPMFGKPVAGMWSVGVSSLSGLGADGSQLRLDDGRSVAVADYAAEVAGYSENGYLFQERLKPHPFVEEVCGDRIATARLIVILEEGRPSILRSVWKVPAGANLADNFWRPGNLLGDVDPDQGRVRRVVIGVGPEQQVVDRHPDTGRQLKGETLPDWDALKSLCLEAAAALPELRLQAWDVAMCDRGPVLLELNIGGDFNLPQIAGGRGLMDERFRSFLASCGETASGFWARRSRKRIADGIQR